MKCRCSNCGWLEVNPNGAMFCGYSDEPTWENESCLAWKDKDEPITNADRIRAMTDEELAEFISGKARTFGEEYEGYMSALDWLREEAAE